MQMMRNIRSNAVVALNTYLLLSQLVYHLKSMKLNIKQRSASDNANQFVRLHPNTLRNLFLQAQQTNHVFTEEEASPNSWSIHHESLEDILFLPLRFKPNNSHGDDWIYCSYNGGYCEEGKMN